MKLTSLILPLELLSLRFSRGRSFAWLLGGLWTTAAYWTGPQPVSAEPLHSNATETMSRFSASASIRTLFDSLDRDGDASLDRSEIPGPDTSLLAFDSSGDGRIDFSEFGTAVTGHWNRPKLGSGLLSEHYVWLMAEAGADLERALEIGRSGLKAVGPDFRLHLHVGWLALRMGQLDLASSCATIASEVDPGAGDPGCLVAAIHLSRQSPEEAIAILEASLELPSYSTCGHLSLARLKSSMGASEEARSILESALIAGQASPADEVELRLLLSEINLRLGRAGEAGIHALQALSLDPGNGNAWTATAMALEATSVKSGVRDLATEVRMRAARLPRTTREGERR